MTVFLPFNKGIVRTEGQNPLTNLLGFWDPIVIGRESCVSAACGFRAVFNLLRPRSLVALPSKRVFFFNQTLKFFVPSENIIIIFF